MENKQQLIITIQRIFDGSNVEIYFEAIAKDLNGVEVKKYKRNDNNKKSIYTVANEISTALIKKGFGIYDIDFIQDDVR